MYGFGMPAVTGIVNNDIHASLLVLLPTAAPMMRATVAEGLGITTESLRAWRRQLGGVDAVPTTAGDGKLPAIAPTSQELQAEVRRLRAQLQSVTNQRDILKKAVGIFAGPNGSVSP